jgi:SAM-dependent MidA family methyltransferase
MVSLAQIIREEISKQGVIPFSRYMELALYCPDYGFYEKEGDNIGRGGDFYTSVSVGPLFGEFLGFQSAIWFDKWARQGEAGGAGGLRLIEGAAHDGQLGYDVLTWLKRQRPEVFERTEYIILEPSSRRREWQRETLALFADKVRWDDDFPAEPIRNTQHATRFTVCYSNELLDAMPVRRFGWDAAARTWFEWGVASEGERLVWARLSSKVDSTSLKLPSSPELLDVLPDGYIMEISPAAEEWWSRAARSLKNGKLLTFDYGFGANEVLLPERHSGTLRAYRQHKQVADVLAEPGKQDITAHVNFPRIAEAGIAAGLTTEFFETQGRFLTSVAAEAWKPEANFGPWDQKRTRQFQTLTHPQHLGRSFRVLIQSRD